MWVLKTLTLLFLIGSVSLAAHQIVSKMSSNDTEQVVTKPKIRIVSAIPRYVTGHYGLGNVFLLDNGSYWAAGYDGEHTDTMFHSNNKGKSWQRSSTVSGTGYNTKAVMFADAENGWAVGVRGLIVRTTNGGKSWEPLRIETNAELNVVHFFNAKIGYVAGYERVGNSIDDEVTGSVEIYCTEDGGVTWRLCYKKDEPGIVFKILALSGTEALVIFDGIKMIRTDNRGIIWKDELIKSPSITSMAFIPNGMSWVVGRKGFFQYSSDHGKTWNKPSTLNQSISEQDWNDIAFNSDGVGLAVGENGAIALTTDNGKTWEQLELIKSDDLRTVQIHYNDAVILGAKKLYSLDISEALNQASSTK